MRHTSRSGVFVVTVTPFAEAGALDEPNIRELVECACGVFPGVILGQRVCR